MKTKLRIKIDNVKISKICILPNNRSINIQRKWDQFSQIIVCIDEIDSARKKSKIIFNIQRNFYYCFTQCFVTVY
jgi:hypothetical protein